MTAMKRQQLYCKAEHGHNVARNYDTRLGLQLVQQTHPPRLYVSAIDATIGPNSWK